MNGTFSILVTAVLGAALLGPAVAEDTPARKAFRVCHDPNNLPFSSVKRDGYENRIAELFARDLNLPVEYYAFPQRLAFIRNTLRYKLPGEDYRCDIVMGVPAGFDQVSATQPYYRSTYAMVFAKGRGMDEVKSAEDFLKLGPERLAQLKIGIYDRTPASQWLNKHGLVDRAVPYPIMSPLADQYPGEIIEKDLAGGKLDAAIVWGPIAGYFAKRVRTPELVVVPLASEPGVRFDYAMAMGVRYGEGEWKQQIEGLIDKHRGEITAILQEFGVPLLDNDRARVDGR
jgi:mxaJ protein